MVEQRERLALADEPVGWSILTTQAEVEDETAEYDAIRAQLPSLLGTRKTVAVEDLDAAYSDVSGSIPPLRDHGMSSLMMRRLSACLVMPRS